MAMIAYEELVAGLTQWRMRQGLPTSQSDYLTGAPSFGIETPVGGAQYGDQTGEVDASDLEVLDEGDAYAYEADATEMHAPIDEAGADAAAAVAPPPLPNQGAYADDQDAYAHGDDQGYSIEAEAPAEPESPFDVSGFEEPSAPPAEYQEAGAYEEAPAAYEEAPAAYEEAPAQEASAFDEAPTGYAEAPAAYEQAPAQEASAFDEAPTGYAEAPAAYEEAPAAYEEAPAAYEEAPAHDDVAFEAAPAFDDPAADAAPAEAYSDDEATVIGDALPDAEPAYEPPPLADLDDAGYGAVDLEAEPAEEVSSMVIDEAAVADDDPFGEPPPLAPPPDDDESR